MTGRKPFVPTDDQRRMVRALSGYGVPHDDIALIVKCSPPTLRKRFRRELDLGSAEANAKVAQTLFQQATSGTNTAAMIFWMKARAGWREKQVVEVTGKDDAPAMTFIRFVGGRAGDAERATSNGQQPMFPSYKHPGHLA